MRRIIEADIKFLSLCPAGKNGLVTLFKSAEGRDSATFCALTKEMDEKGQILGVVYAPERPDADGDWADAAVIEKMAHSFLRNGGKLDIIHNEKVLTPEQAHVAESFVVQKGDPRFAGIKDASGKIVDVTGAWGVVLQVNDPALRKAYRDGAWRGLSLAGPAKVVHEDLIKMTRAEAFEALRRLFDTNPTPTETDMTKQEIEAVLDAKLPSLVEAAVAKAIKPAAPAAPKAEEKPAAPAAPAIDEAADPVKVLAKAKIEALKKAATEADMSTAEGRKAYREAVAEIETEFAPTKKADERGAKSTLQKGADAPATEPAEAALVKSGDAWAKALGY